MVAHTHQLDLDRVRPSALSRTDRAASGRHGDLWRRFTAFTLSERWRTLTRMQQAVVTNLTDLVTLGDAEDLVNLGCLIRSHGHEEVAAAQNLLDALLGLGPDQPTLTAAVRRLGAEERNRSLLLGAGRGSDDAEQIAVTCYQHAFWILLTGIDESGPPLVLQSAADMVRVVGQGNVRLWRAALSPVAANPWSPYGERLARLALEAHLPLVAHAIVECRRIYRARQEEQERMTIAREIRRLIAISGCSQREFAGYVGTSPSRLSTYATGKVTPSAAMLLRIQRAARGLYERAHPPQLQVVDGPQAPVTRSRPA